METYKRLIYLKQNISDLGLSQSEITSSTTYSVTTERHDTVIKVTFSGGSYAYTAYIGAASLYKYSKDSSEPYYINIKGKDVYLDSKTQPVINDSIQLHPYETIIIREAL
jgi:hypothetical protein